jgi:hypothetical protein
VTLAPVLAHLMTQWLSTGRQPDALRPYAPSRFGL